MRILIVEESDKIAIGLTDAIGQFHSDASVVRTPNSQSAELLMRKDFKFDVALIATNSTDSEASSISARLRELCPSLVIVVITGGDSSETALGLIRLGVQDCIPRQEVSPGRLLRTIEIARERHRREQQLRKLACTDSLTGSLNRRGLIVAAKDVHRSTLAMNETSALLTLDLDQFKQINDKFGHAVGDMLLKACCQRIRYCIRDMDFVGRVGGDEFWVILNSVGNAANTPRIAEKILSRVEAPMLLDGEKLRISASIGIALLPDHCTSVEGWIRKSDEAMYEAKRQGKNCWSMFESSQRPLASQELPRLAI